MPDHFTPDEERELHDDNIVLHELLKRQTRAIERLAKHFSPEEVEAQARNWRRYLTRLAAVTTILGSGVLGSWELLAYLKQQWDIEALADQYAKVAQQLYYRENNPEVASEFIGKAIKLKESVADYWQLQACIEGMAVVRTLMNLDRPLLKEEVDKAHQALAHAELVLGLGERPDAYILRGQVYAALGEIGRAKEDFQKAVTLDPTNDFVRTRLAMLKADEPEGADKALADLDATLSANPKSKLAHLWRGVILADKKGDWDGARKAYEQALAIDERYDLAYYNLAWTYLSQKPQDYDKARGFFEKALTINPAYKEAYYGLAMVHGYQNAYEIALIYLDKAIDIDKTYLTAWKWRGVMRVEQGTLLKKQGDAEKADAHDDKAKELFDKAKDLFSKAHEDFTQAITLSPRDSDLYVRRGRVREKQGEIQAAVSDLRFAAQLTPRDKKTWLYLGDLFAQLDEREKALGYYQQALGIDPKYDDALAQTAALYAKQGDVDKALAAYGEAIANTKYKPERYQLLRGHLLASQGKLDAAIADFRAARTADPELAEAWLAEAQTLFKAKDKAAATEAVSKYIDLEPTDPDGQELRKQIEALQ